MSREGIPCISPHANSKEFTREFTWAKCLGLDISLLRGCDFVLALPGWKQSTGCVTEVRFAQRNDIPVFYSLHEVMCFVQSTFKKMPLGLKLEAI